MRMIGLTAITFTAILCAVEPIFADLRIAPYKECWDFTNSVTPFFGHWTAVVACPRVIAHYRFG